MAIVALYDRLFDLVDRNAQAEKIATGYRFTEGPVWDHRNKTLYFGDIPGNAQHRWTAAGGAKPWRVPSNQGNGTTIDAQGRLITCHHDRYVTRTNLADDSVEVIAKEYKGGKLNSPNDVIVARNGDVIFTDPTFGLRQPDGTVLPQETPCPGIYRLAPDGTMTLLVEDFVAPNGLVLSNDGKRLYIDDTRERHVRVFDVADDGSLSNSRVFCEIKHEAKESAPDGMKMDSLGNLYVTSNRADGIWVFDRDGTLLGFIGVGDEPMMMGAAEQRANVGGGPANCAWGDDDWQTLYITAVTSIYRIRMKVAGQPVGV
ncbi:MAG TPA: SMP-30/gluconolactonase/LRE family protein [Dehalococcoidia bacterium]|nr:SMP-30/gluconolactonase/LRE family protein [Dehalococcoidia bacterium]